MQKRIRNLSNTLFDAGGGILLLLFGLVRFILLACVIGLVIALTILAIVLIVKAVKKNNNKNAAPADEQKPPAVK